MVPKFILDGFWSKKGACGNATSRKKLSLAYKMPIWLQKKGQKNWPKFWPKFWSKFWPKFWSKFWSKFWPKFWGTVLGEFFVAIRPLPKKNLVGSLLPRRQPVVIAKIKKNVKIGLKWLPVGAFWTSPIPKCTEKQDLQPRNGDIAPKPLK